MLTNADYAVIGGGYANSNGGFAATVAGGYGNLAEGNSSTVGGGRFNRARGLNATVPGGAFNEALGDYGFAAGQHAKANHQGTFVWADNSTSDDFASAADNQFLIRAGFVGINRPTQITGAEYFGVRAPVTNSYGGMYVETAGPGLPFYGYAQFGFANAWTYLDGLDGNKWKLYNGGDWLTVTTNGNVGIPARHWTSTASSLPPASSATAPL